MYAHTPHRDWEGDANMTREAIADGCKDIAQQLAAWSHGDGFEVIFGGGRDRFLPDTMNDPEDTDKKWLAQGRAQPRAGMAEPVLE
jgi:alkaline phosphatase